MNMDLSNFIQAPAYTEVINVKSMDVSDSEIDHIQNFPRLPILSNKNDPWKPMEPENLAIPKIQPAPADPLRSMISSESYVKSLEKRLSKIKGKTDVVRSKDIIQSLQEVRDLHTSQYMMDTSVDTYNESFNPDTNDSVISSVQRRLNPERQALNPQELVPLVNEDVLAKTSEEDDTGLNAEKANSEEKT